MTNETIATETWEERHARERRAQIDARLAHCARGKAIAAELSILTGEKWTAVVHRDTSMGDLYSRLELHQGARVVDVDQLNYPAADRGKLAIRGNYPRTADGALVHIGDDKLPSIKVAASKSDQQVAKDIARRFLPEFTERFNRLTDRVRSADDYRANTLRNAETLARLVGDHISDQQKRNGTITIYARKLSSVYTIEVSGDSVSMKVNLKSVADAETVLDLLTTLTPRE